MYAYVRMIIGLYHREDPTDPVETSLQQLNRHQAALKRFKLRNNALPLLRTTKTPGYPYMTDIIIETSTPFSNDTSASNDMPASSDTPAAPTLALSTESNFATVNQKR